MQHIKLIEKVKDFAKLFIKNKWHYHSLTLPLVLLSMWLVDKYNILQLRDTGNFFVSFLAIFVSAAVAFMVEWVEGVFFGANKTPSEAKASNLDMLVSIIAGALGVVIHFLL
jgi:hypothetical protein